MTIAGQPGIDNFSCGEPYRTHFDAPIHWVSGRDLRITRGFPAVQQLIGAACVIDCSAPASADPDFLLTADYLEDWDSRARRIRRVLGADAHGLVETTDPVAYQTTTRPDSTPRRQSMRSGSVDDRDVAGFRLRNDRHRCRAAIT